MLGFAPLSAGRAALRVMLVEDHGLVRSAVRRTLNVQGIHVVEEASTAEAIHMAAHPGREGGAAADAAQRSTTERAA